MSLYDKFLNILKGIVDVTPRIIKGIEHMFFTANEGYTYTVQEMDSIKSQYAHLMRKLFNLKDTLGLKVQLENPPKVLKCVTNTDGMQQVHPSDIDAVVGFSREVLLAFEKAFEEELFPRIMRSYIEAEGEDTNPFSVLDSLTILEETRFSKLHEDMFVSVRWQDRLGFRSLEDNLVNLHMSENLVIMVDKMFDEAILALLRIHPMRMVCPMTKFLHFTSSDLRWEMQLNNNDCIWIMNKDEKKKQISGFSVGISGSILSTLRKYDTVYDFYLHLGIQVRSADCKQTGIVNRIIPVSHHTNEIEVVLDLESKDFKLGSYQLLDTRIFGHIKNHKVSEEQIKELHLMEVEKITYLDLLTKGSSGIKDPNFSIKSIYAKSIGTAGYAIQSAITILKVWLSTYDNNTNLDDDITYRKRYTAGQLGDITELLCQFSVKLNLSEFQKPEFDAARFNYVFNLIIRDLRFAKKLILRDRFGRTTVKLIVAASEEK